MQMKILDTLKGKAAVWFVEGLDRDTWRRKLAARVLYKKAIQIMEGTNMKSWKTTLAGVGAILGSLGALAKGIADGDKTLIGTSISGIVAGVGLIFARDNNKTSEDVGAK